MSSSLALGRTIRPNALQKALIAARDGSVDDLRRILFQYGAGMLAEPDELGWVVAHAAARNGHLAVLQFIADEHRGIGFTTATNTHGITPAHLAARSGHVDVLRLLADTVGTTVLTTVDRDGWLPLHSAARGGHVAALRFMVEGTGDWVLTAREHPVLIKTTLHKIAERYEQHEVINYLALANKIRALAVSEPEPYPPAGSTFFDLCVLPPGADEAAASKIGGGEINMGHFNESFNETSYMRWATQGFKVKSPDRTPNASSNKLNMLDAPDGTFSSGGSFKGRRTPDDTHSATRAARNSKHGGCLDLTSDEPATQPSDQAASLAATQAAATLAPTQAATQPATKFHVPFTV